MSCPTPTRAAILEKFGLYVKSDVREDVQVFGKGLDMESVAYAEFICDVEDTWDLDLDLDKLGPVDQTVGDLLTNIVAQLPK